MIRPQDSRTRERRSLNGLWRFSLDRAGLRRGREMAVPASYNDIGGDAALRNHIGAVWYETEVRIPSSWSGRRICLYLESVTHAARVWADGVEAGAHQGGYTPFEVDLTALAAAGEVVTVTVAVDKTVTLQRWAPRTGRSAPSGSRIRRSGHPVAAICTALRRNWWTLGARSWTATCRRWASVRSRYGETGS